MRRILIAAFAVGLAAGPAAAADKLQDENILLPLPKDFKMGSHSRTGPVEMTEFVPNAETVENWSTILTEQIAHGLSKRDPDSLAQGMTPGWSSGCPGGKSQRLIRTTENGYEVSIWVFTCPNNPKTGKPESMFMKVISGADALYNVQYAVKQPVTAEVLVPTMQYLKGILVCDTRAADHACPAGIAEATR
jgi:hypothetical protein